MDWVRFLEENNVSYITRGPNTKKGEVSIHCPLCGDADPSEHLGINLRTGKWGCLREQTHRGKAARTLIKAILSCSSNQSQLIVKQYSHSNPDGLEEALALLEGTPLANPDLQTQIKHQKLGPQFNDFNQIKVRGITKRFFEYLRSRGYENPKDIIEYYDLRCAMVGRYKDRIIIPIKMNGELLGWTSRALGAPVNAPRYLASNEDVKTTVFNYDELKAGGERLFIVEGPFDAIRIDSFGLQCEANTDPHYRNPSVKFRATCTFGTSVTLSQIALLRSLTKKFKQTWILFDKGAEKPASDLADWTGAKLAFLPERTEDPGELELDHLDQLSEKMFNGWFGFRHVNRHVKMPSSHLWYVRSNTKPKPSSSKPFPRRPPVLLPTK
jgi:hypothetical protein